MNHLHHQLRHFVLALVAALPSSSILVLAQAPAGWGCATQTPGNPRSTNCSESGSNWLATYRHKEHWIPNSLTPIKTLHVNFHIWQRADGTGNLDDTPANHARLHTVIDWVNQNYWTNLPNTNPLSYSVPFTNSSRIHVVLDSIYFYQDPSTDSSYCVSNAYGHNATLTAYLDQNYPERRRALNLHLARRGAGWGSSTAAGYSDNGSIESFYRVNPEMNDNPVHDYWYAQHLTHEIGHSFDLWHTYGSGWQQNCTKSNFDFLWDLYDTTATSCPGSTCQSCLIPGSSTNNNFMGGGGAWHLTTLQMGIVQRSTVLENFHNYNYGIRDHLTGYSTVPWEVTTDETWDFSMKFYQDLVVKSGATLTVKCDLRFVPQAGVIVEPGAKLIIDGGKLTNEWYYQDFWRGIEIWGDNAHNQSGYPIPTYQGMLVLKNGAVIEHARNITLQQPGAYGTFGGVMQATDATFLNCHRSAEFLAFQNTNFNGQPIGNRSFYTRCKFIVDDHYRGGDDFAAHVTMWQVDGINFMGCNFKNLQTTITESDKLGQGIIGLDAQFTVAGYCSSIQQYGVPCPPTNLTRSTFEGLDHGIQASVSSTDRTFSITDCDFTDNVIGVYSNAVNSFHVFRSNFIGGGRQVAAMGLIDQTMYFAGGHHGIYSTDGHGFRIEENSFARSTGAHNLFTGTRINNSGEYNSQVYKNTATGPNQAFVGEGKCIDETQAAYVGLQFLCNSNSNPGGTDIYDRKIGATHNNHSIRTQQGSSSTPAGNTFTQETVPMDESDFKNNTDWVLNYWYNDGSNPAAKPLDYTPGWVGITYTTHTNGCPSHLAGRVPQHYTEAQMNEVRAEFATAKTAYINTAYTYNALLDGGNTDALIGEVQESWPQDVWPLHDKLIAKSPYLSTEVLRSVVEKNILPQAMLLEVLLANPDGTKKDGFIKWLQYEAPWPLPQYMIDLIVGSWDQKTFRTQLESDMGQHHADMSFAADELIGEWKNATGGIRTDSILARWQQVPSLGARYSEALTRLERREYGPAKDLMLGLDTQYKLSDDQAKERDDAVTYITVLANAHGAGHDLMRLDGMELAALRNIAAAGCERPALWAQNILCFGYGECYTPCTGEGAAQKMLQLPRPAAPTAEPSPLAVYPNPATSYVTLAYTLADAPEDAVLVLRGVDGRELKRMPLNAQKGQQLLDTRSYPPGTYSVELLNNGGRIATERLVLKP